MEARLGAYIERDEDEEVELAIVLPEGFDTTLVDGVTVLEAQISYPADRAHLVWPVDKVVSENPGDYGFHYTPYNFDSSPESDFYERILRVLNLDRADVNDIYFTGAITDPKKTDLAFAYERDGRVHHLHAGLRRPRQR